MLQTKRGTQYTTADGKLYTLVSLNIRSQQVKYTVDESTELQVMSVKEWQTLDANTETSEPEIIGGATQMSESVSVGIDSKFAMMDKSEWQVLELNKEDLLIKNTKNGKTQPFPKADFAALLEVQQIKIIS